MSWQQWLNRGEVQAHSTSLQELDAMRALIRRDLADAAITALSEDRRFATAYNAALQSASMVVACSGYRVTAKVGHHKVSFAAAALALGPQADRYTAYFDRCRRKRNVIDYITASVATETEADELLRLTKEFNEIVERWIAVTLPAFAP